MSFIKFEDGQLINKPSFADYASYRRNITEQAIIKSGILLENALVDNNKVRFDIKTLPISFNEDDIMYLYQFPTAMWTDAMHERYNRLLFDYDTGLKQDYLLKLLQSVTGVPTNTTQGLLSLLGNEELSVSQKLNNFTKQFDNIDKEDYKKWRETKDKSHDKYPLYRLIRASGELTNHLNNAQNRNRDLFPHPIQVVFNNKSTHKNVEVQHSGDQRTETWSILNAIRGGLFRRILESKGFDPRIWSLVNISGKKNTNQQQKSRKNKFLFVKSHIEKLHDRLTKYINKDKIPHADYTHDKAQEYLHGTNKETYADGTPKLAAGTHGYSLSYHASQYADDPSGKEQEELLDKMYHDHSNTVTDIGANYVGMSRSIISRNVQHWLRAIREGAFFSDSPQDIQSSNNISDKKRIQNTAKMKEYGIPFDGNIPATVDYPFSGNKKALQSKEYNYAINQEAFLQNPFDQNNYTQTGDTERQGIPLGNEGVEKIVNIINEGREQALTSYLQSLQIFGKVLGNLGPSLCPFDPILAGKTQISPIKNETITQIAQQKYKISNKRNEAIVEIPFLQAENNHLTAGYCHDKHAPPFLVSSAITDSNQFKAWRHHKMMEDWSQHLINNREDRNNVVKLLEDPKELSKRIAECVSFLSKRFGQENADQRRKRTAVLHQKKFLEELQHIQQHIYPNWRRLTLSHGKSIDDQQSLKELFRTVQIDHARKKNKAKNDMPLWSDFDVMMLSLNPAAVSLRTGGVPRSMGVTSPHKGSMEMFFGDESPIDPHSDLVPFFGRSSFYTDTIDEGLDTQLPVQSYAYLENPGLLTQTINDLQQKIKEAYEKRADRKYILRLENKLDTFIRWSKIALVKSIKTHLQQLNVLLQKGKRDKSGQLRQPYLTNISTLFDRLKQYHDQITHHIQNIHPAAKQNEAKLQHEHYLEIVKVCERDMARFQQITQHNISDIDNMLQKLDQYKIVESSKDPDMQQTAQSIHECVQKLKSLLPEEIAKEHVTSLSFQILLEANALPEDERNLVAEISQIENAILKQSKGIGSHCKELGKLTSYYNLRTTKGNPPISSPEGHFSDSIILYVIKRFLKQKKQEPDHALEAGTLEDNLLDVYQAAEEYVLHNNKGRPIFLEWKKANDDPRLHSADVVERQQAQLRRLHAGQVAQHEAGRLAYAFISSVYEANLCGRGSRRTREQKASTTPAIPQEKQKQYSQDLLNKFPDLLSLVLSGMSATSHMAQAGDIHQSQAMHDQKVADILKQQKQKNDELLSLYRAKAQEQSDSQITQLSQGSKPAQLQQIIINLSRKILPQMDMNQSLLPLVKSLGYSDKEANTIVREITKKQLDLTECIQATHKHQHIARLMQHAALGSIPSVKDILTDGDTKRANTIVRLLHSWKEWHEQYQKDPNAKDQIINSEEFKAIKQKLQEVKQKQEKPEESKKEPDYHNIDIRMIGDYILSYFANEHVFYAFGPQDFPEKGKTPPPLSNNIQASPNSLRIHRITDGELIAKINSAWGNALRQQEQQPIPLSMRFVYCSILHYPNSKQANSLVDMLHNNSFKIQNRNDVFIVPFTLQTTEYIQQINRTVAEKLESLIARATQNLQSIQQKSPQTPEEAQALNKEKQKATNMLNTLLATKQNTRHSCLASFQCSNTQCPFRQNQKMDKNAQNWSTHPMEPVAKAFLDEIVKSASKSQRNWTPED